MVSRGDLRFVLLTARLPGCPAARLPDRLADADRDASLAGLPPGTEIDHRDTSFTGLLLEAREFRGTGEP